LVIENERDRVPDAIVVGAGHNGLVAAVVMARAGLSVTIVEAADVVGGACRTEPRRSGPPRVPTCSA
jgi:phytoene dehydrogenase-like protein